MPDHRSSRPGARSQPLADPSRPGHQRQLLGWTVFGLFGIWFAWGTISTFARWIQFEDQLIVLRYARNLVEGNGLVYNFGERVQGFTTPLFTLLSAVAVAIGGEHAPAWQNTFGVLCIIGTSAMAVRLLLRAAAGAAAPLAVALITFFSLEGETALYLGMEVHLFAFLLLLALDLHLRGRSTLAAVVSGLLFLTRPEGVLLTVILLGHNWFTTQRLPLREATAALTTVAPWLLFAGFYYGSPVTSTLQAKLGLNSPWDYAVGFAGFQVQQARGFVEIYTGPLPSTGIFVASLLLLPLTALAIGAVVLMRRRLEFWPLLAFPLVWFAGFAAIGPPVEHKWHYFFINSLAAVLISAGLHATLLRIARLAADHIPVIGRLSALGPLVGRRSGHAVVAAVGVWLVTLPLLFSTGNRLAAAPKTAPEQADPRAAPGPWLRERYDRSTSILAREIGFLGWQSRLRIIDGAGLVTPGLRWDTPRIEILERHMPDLVLLQAAADLPRDRPWMYHRIENFNGSADYNLYSRADPAFLYQPLRGPEGPINGLLRRSVDDATEPPTQISVVRSPEIRGILDTTTIESLAPRTDLADVTLMGWAIDTASTSTVDTVVAVIDDENIVSSTVALPRRPDVAGLLGREFEYSGFVLRAKAEREQIERDGVAVYAVSNRGVAIRLPFSYLALAGSGNNEVLSTTDGRRLAVQPTGRDLFEGAIDLVSKPGNRTLIEGWAADLQRGERPRQIVVYRDGQYLLAMGANRERPDVAEHHADPRLLRTGFRGAVPGAAEPTTFAERHRVFALMARGAAVELRINAPAPLPGN